jgi:penicillin-binding protein 1C
MSGEAQSSSLWKRAGRRRKALGATCALLTLVGVYAHGVLSRATLVAPEPTPFVTDRNGAFLTQIGHQSGKRVDYGYWPLAATPPRVARATLALEDRRFAAHPGVDALAIGRAARQSMLGGRRSGASTIAMQVARMQTPAPRTLWTKAVEAGAGVALTWRYGREALLAHYLRLTPYGNGSHGVAHAARFYFDKPVDDLSWAEIALLSAVPQSPTRMNLFRHDGLARAVKRGHRALDELARQSVINEAELALAHRQLASLSPPRALTRPPALHAILRLEELIRKGRVAPRDPSDPRIRASLDLATQDKAAALAQRFVAGWRWAGAEQAAIIVAARGTGEVLAHVGSIDYRDRRNGAVDFTRRPRSPGSTLKPFVFALALERGVIRPTDVLADLPEGASGIGNADGQYLGPLLPRQALANSRNVPATNLLRRIGLETNFRFLRDLRLHDIEAPADSFGLSMAIGAVPTTLEKLVRAYGALAEDGRLHELEWSADPTRRAPTRVLSADSARLVASFLSDPQARLPSFPRYGAMEYPFPVAVKTGTSQGFRDAWTLAFSERYVIGVWIGRGDAGPMIQMSGGRSAARVAQALMTALHGALPGDLADGAFPAPGGRVAVEMCMIGGKRSNGECGPTLTEWARPDEEPPLAATLASVREGGARPVVAVPATQRAWAREEGYSLNAPEAGNGEVKLYVAAPENNSRIWLNPETPPHLNRLALKATVEPRAPQVMWVIDGEPFALADPDDTVWWPMRKGVHRIQLRLPLRDGASRTIRVVVE